MCRPRTLRRCRLGVGLLGWVVSLAVLAGAAPGGQPSEDVRPRVSVRLPSAVLGVAFSADGRQVALACDDKTILIHDAATFEHRGTLRGHSERVWSVAFSPDGRTLVSSSGDYGKPTVPGEIKVWDLATGKERLSLTGHAGLVFLVAFDPGGKVVASASWDGNAKFWDLATGRETATLPAHNGPVRHLAYSPDGSILATASKDGTVGLWDTATQRNVRSIPAHAAGAQRAAFDPTGRLLATCDWPNTKSEVKLWDVTTGREVVCWPGLATKVLSLDFSPDGQMLAVAGGFSTRVGEVRLIEVASGQVRADFRGHEEWVETVRFSPDGQMLASGGGYTREKPGEFRLWHLADLQDAGAARDARSAQDLEVQWDALADRDATRAYRAILTLTAAPVRLVVQLLKDRLRPSEAADPAQLARLIADLDSDFFATRQRASVELERLGDVAQPALAKALATTIEPEVRQRLEALLKQPDFRISSPTLLRGLRAVEVLDHIDTPEARLLLEDLAKGAADARQTLAARAALARHHRPPGDR